MLKQRTINLNPDEVLIIKSGSDPREMAELRILYDITDEAHVFVAARPFAYLHTNKSPDQIRLTLSIADESHQAEIDSFERNR